jgi:hypothetical protein
MIVSLSSFTSMNNHAEQLWVSTSIWVHKLVSWALCLISSTNLPIYPVLTSANNAPGPLSEGFVISSLAQTLPSSMAAITSVDSLPNIVPLHEPCYPPTIMTASIFASHYMLDVPLPGTICSPMVVISFHGRDYMGRERLKVLAEDWDKPGECEWPVLYLCLHFFLSTWCSSFQIWMEHHIPPSADPHG